MGVVQMTDGFRYSIDLFIAQARAEKIIECIKQWQAEHDLRPFEYTNHLRVSPTSIPHSHPVLTLNTELYDPNAILCEYLHEQMHWYLTKLATADKGSHLIAELKRRYPGGTRRISMPRVGVTAARTASPILVELALAHSERFELPTLGIEIRCSIQLSYECVEGRLADLACEGQQPRTATTDRHR